MAGAASLTGCTGSSAPGPTPSQTTTSPSPSPSLTAAQQLQQLAALGAKAVFRATYLVRQRHPSSKATWRVWRTDTKLRVDVVTRHSTATLISTPGATFACNRAPHHRACFRVATRGKSIPSALKLLAVRLFTTDLVAFGKHPERYGIAAASPGSVPGPTHGGTCFHLTVPKQTKRGDVQTGSYCFDRNGLLTVVLYPNGNVVRLTHVALQTPPKSIFVPYSSPTPLPG